MRLSYSFLMLALALMVAMPASAQSSFTNGPINTGGSVDYSVGGGVSVTHSLDTATANAGVACATTGTSFTTANQTLRVFILSDFPQVTGDFDVTSVDVGISPIDLTLPGNVDSNVNLYKMAGGVDLSGGNFAYADLTAIGTGTINHTGADKEGMYNVPVASSMSLTPSDTLVVEYATPDGTVAGNEFGIRAAGNDGGETDFSYLAATDCGIVDPTAVTNIGSFTNSMWTMVVNGAFASANEGPAVPQTFALGQSYPNPFNPSATIPFEVNETSAVRISVYDALGREVTVLVNETFTPGAHSVSFDAVNLPSGTYMYRLEANGEIQMRTMSLLK